MLAQLAWNCRILTSFPTQAALSLPPPPPKTWSSAPFLLQPQRESPPPLMEEQSRPQLRALRWHPLGFLKLSLPGK